MYSRAIGPHRASLPTHRTECTAEVFMSRLHVFLAIVPLTCIAIGSTIAWSNIAGSTGVRAYVTKVDFDQAFADAAAGQRESEPTIRQKFRDAALKEVAAPSPRPFAGTNNTWNVPPVQGFE